MRRKKSKLAMGSTADGDALPRLTKDLEVADLKAEAEARGIDSTRLPSRKDDLLRILIEGSIHLSGTSAWKEVKRLKIKINEERAVLTNISNETQGVHPEKRRQMKYRKESNARTSDSRLRAPTSPPSRFFARESPGKVSQGQSHPVSPVQCDNYSSASTACNCQDGRRDFSASPAYTCERCGFDICTKCFECACITEKEKMEKRESHEGGRKTETDARERRVEMMETGSSEADFTGISELEKNKVKSRVVTPTRSGTKPERNDKKEHRIWRNSPHGGIDMISNYPEKLCEAHTPQNAHYLSWDWRNDWGLPPLELDDGMDLDSEIASFVDDSKAVSVPRSHRQNVDSRHSKDTTGSTEGSDIVIRQMASF